MCYKYNTELRFLVKHKKMFSYVFLVRKCLKNCFVYSFKKTLSETTYPSSVRGLHLCKRCVQISVRYLQWLLTKTFLCTGYTPYLNNMD